MGKSLAELQQEIDQENAALQAAPVVQRASTPENDEDEGDAPDVAPIPPQQPLVTVTADTLAGAIVKATEMASGTRRKIPYGQQQIRSPFNPTGNRHRKLNRHVYQNGYRLNVKLLHDEEIALLNGGQILPGRYLDKLITVRIEDEEDGTSAMHFDYKNKTADQRMSLGMRLGAGGGKTGFENLLRLIVKEIEQNKTDAKARRRQEVAEALA